jgi:adenine-specific DNA-methyltransferase
MPSAMLVIERSDALRAIKQQVGQLLDDGRLLDAVQIVDQVLFPPRGDLSAKQITKIRQARKELAHRRTMRGASGR